MSQILCSRCYHVFSNRSVYIIWLNSGTTPWQYDENGGFSQYAFFEKHIREGDWDAANRFICSSPEAVTAKISIFGSTALHIAIFEGHMNIVEELVKIMSEENLKIKDADDYTVLGYCAKVGNIQMAKCIIEKSQTLLRIKNGIYDLIPVVVALTFNPDGTEMARYLYSETPLEDLMPRNGINGAMFITRAIYSKAIGKNFRFNYIFLFISLL